MLSIFAESTWSFMHPCRIASPPRFRHYIYNCKLFKFLHHGFVEAEMRGGPGVLVPVQETAEKVTAWMERGWEHHTLQHSLNTHCNTVQHKTGDSERSYNLNKAWLRVELTIPHTMKRCCEQQTLQHTLKTHCNTLQHTATQMEDCNTHCNTHCNTCCNAYGVAMKCCWVQSQRLVLMRFCRCKESPDLTETTHALVQRDDDDCFFYHSWRHNVVIAFGTLSSFLT